MTARTLDGLIARAPLLARAALAVIVTAGLLLWMVIDRAGILRSGTTVRLQTQPVDPRDLFRGDYVILTYRISFIAPDLVRGGATFRRGDRVWVELDAPADRPATVAAAHASRPAAAPGRLLLAGVVDNPSACLPTDNANTFRCGPDRPPGIRVRYGLESYFVPEGEGRAIETLPSSRVEVVASVASDGRSAIRALLVDGKRVYDEPPF
jgi:uncharacterized membrane-anchored protein